MKKNTPSQTIILASGLAVVVLSVVLFVNALSISDFAQTGQPFYRLVLSFILLGTVTLVLLGIVYRGSRSPVRPSSSAASKRKEPLPTAVGKDEVAEVQAESKTEAAEQQADARELLSETAGELRTSVDVMQEELEEIIDEEVPADKEHMQTLYEETDRLRKIIDGIELLSQAQSLARSLSKESVMVEPLLSGLLDKARSSAQGRSVTFTLECEPGLTMTANPDSLGRIMDNLLDNAVKAVRDSGSVAVSAARKGEQIVFTIKDTGIGIKRQHLSHIYERFFRGTGTGIGMGLAIVKELVDAGGGQIEVQTKPGEGTTFSVHLPAA
jgi:two-component system sensor histidine kinase BaeS